MLRKRLPAKPPPTNHMVKSSQTVHKKHIKLSKDKMAKSKRWMITSLLTCTSLLSMILGSILTLSNSKVRIIINFVLPMSIFGRSIEENEQEKVLEMYSREEIENFRMIFEMFDPNKTGFVMVKDLETILKSLGRDPSEANELVNDMQNE